jgi:putative ABC transport system ATP-binding protein
MMLSFEKVTKKYQLDLETSITPVKEVSLDIREGEFIIIIGRSGSGKTTLLNLAAGMVKPTLGRVIVNDLDVGKLSDRSLSALRSRYLGFVFQFPSLLPALTVAENVALPAIFANPGAHKDANHHSIEILKMMGLESRLNVYPNQLSAGEQKRVVLSRSLINNPRVILADEPTSDLDQLTEIEVMKLLGEINSRGVTFLMVTHSLALVPYATRAFKMDNGSLTEIPRS